MVVAIYAAAAGVGLLILLGSIVWLGWWPGLIILGAIVGIYRGLELRLVRDPQGLHAVAGLSGGAEVRAQNVHMPGTLCFVALETALAGLETQIRRLSVQRSVLSSRLDSLRTDAPSWPHAERAASILARYDDLCAAVATAGIVDRQHYKFDQ
jgi:hypothetical protein